MKHKVLVLLSTYNGERFLQEQLDSLVAQEDVELHYLIRDDGSHDSTISMLQKFVAENKNVDFRQGNNLGWAESFHTLMNWAYTDYLNKVDYFCFCDQDDIWLPDKVISAVSSLQKEEKKLPLLYFSNVKVIDGSKKYLWTQYPYPSPDTYSPPQTLLGFWFLGCTFCFNRELLSLFIENTKTTILSHDSMTMLWAQFFGTVMYDYAPHILYRQHENNASCNSHKYSLFQRIVNIYRARKVRSEYISSFYDSSKYLDFKYKRQVNLFAQYHYHWYYCIYILFFWKHLGFQRKEYRIDLRNKLKILLNIW